MGFDRARAAKLIGELQTIYSEKFREEWNSGRVPPEWFDHHMDLHRWREHRNPLWVERGTFAVQAMRMGDEVLDLACGDGFYPYCFYSRKAKTILGVDIDPVAIEHARFWHAVQNIAYVVDDVLKIDLPRQFDVVVMNAAIEHFELPELHAVCERMKAWTNPNGIVVGCTIQGIGHKRHPGHGHEFGSKEEMGQTLKEHFPYVAVCDTQHTEDRTNLYFQCSLTPDNPRMGVFKAV